MKNLFLKLFIHFIVLSSVVIGTGEFCFWMLGDNWPARKILKEYKEENYLYGSGYLQYRDLDFKMDMAKLRPSDVVSVGSSRVMQFREQSFYPPVSSKKKQNFYNLGAGSAGTPSTLLGFALNAKDIHPRVVIFGIDFWQLVGPATPTYTVSGLLYRLGLYDTVTTTYKSFFRPFYLALVHRFAGYRQLFKDYSLWYPIIFSRTGNSSASDWKLVGVNANITESGFRSDGSYQYGKFVKRLHDSGFYNEHPEKSREPINKIDDGFLSIKFNGIGWRQRLDLQRAIHLLTKEGIKIILILPPVSKPILDVIESDPPLTNLLNDVFNYLREVSLKNDDVVFYDFTRYQDAGCTASEFYDDWHASEKCFARIALSMTDDEFIGPYVNSPLINLYLKQSDNPFFIYPPVMPAARKVPGDQSSVAFK